MPGFFFWGGGRERGTCCLPVAEGREEPRRGMSRDAGGGPSGGRAPGPGGGGGRGGGGRETATAT